MPFPEGRRIAGAFAALVLALLATAAVSVPAHADAPDDVASVIGPADGAVVGGTRVTFTATAADAGYRFRWAGDDAVDADGRLSGDSARQSTVRVAEYSLDDLPAGTYFWQVRGLDDDAAWSAPRAFTIDPDAEGLQLETYPLDGAPAPPGLLSGIDGRLWIVVAGVFSVALLAAVIPSALRSRPTA